MATVSPEEKRRKGITNKRESKFLAVKSDIERGIISGKYAAGTKIPTIDELTVEYGICRTTAQKVIKTLVEEGTIISKVGIGCFVKPYIRDKLIAGQEREISEAFQNAVMRGLRFGLTENQMCELVYKIASESKKNL